ncbi:MAG: hypothetical protein SFW64_02830 [Alphaproteobacteria bacterium]|nr:hypothetical protein [Alphaproteobacteria bacterium]
MNAFVTFAFYICLSCVLLIIVPVLMVPGLPLRRKLLICTLTFVILVPAALLLYAWIGAPLLAVSG